MLFLFIIINLVACSDVFAVSRHRNTLVIVADDYGFESGVYNNPVISTPNIDNLAKRGVVYQSAYTVVSSCSPSRSAILTGLPPHQNGMYGLHNGYHNFDSFSNVESLPYVLGKHGVRTGIIGKKHVGPEEAYPFDYAETEENNSIMQVGRNITKMKELAHEFLSNKSSSQPFFLYIGFHDPHRCGHTQPQYGVFCEKFGNGQPGMGVIPDWKPQYYSPDKVIVPGFIQDTPFVRGDLSAQYTTISRLDQGVGLIVKELELAGYMDDTLIIFTSDNGIPFPNGRTNLYESGTKEPFILSNPHEKSSWGSRSDVFVSTLDITPTVLDWMKISYPHYKLFGREVSLQGQSLLSNSTKSSYVYGSHSLHEITMYYPMRSVRDESYKLIRNLNFMMPFPIDQDFYLSPSFQDLLNRTRAGEDTHWFKTLKQYYYRPEWELYNLKNDPLERENLAQNKQYIDVLKKYQLVQLRWQNVTHDPWICSPGGVLEDAGSYKLHPVCMSLQNGF